MIKILWLHFIFVFLVPSLSLSASLSNQFISGANTHFAQSSVVPETNLSLAQQGGITSIRDAILWSQVESSKGRYAVPLKLDQAINTAITNGIEPVLILCYGNKIYDNRGMPETEEEQQAFVRYVSFLANYFKGKVKYYEVWNEWNYGAGTTQKYVFVKSIYRGLLGRGGFIDPAIDSGVKSSITAYEKNTITRDAMITSLFNTSEGQALYSATLSDADFIDKLYQNCFLRNATQNEKGAWLAALGTGTLRPDVAKSLVLNPEYNSVWLAKSDCATYVRLLTKSYAALKSIDPAITVLAGAVAGWDGEWLKQMMQYGSYAYLDGVSIHPYNYDKGAQGTPENIVSWLVQIENVLMSYTGAQEVPIYITEVGWPTHTGLHGSTPETSANYFGRLFLLAKAETFIKGIWWYDLRDDGTDPSNPENNFGLVHNDLTHKPAYLSLQDLALLVNVASFDGLKQSDPSLRSLFYKDPDGTTTLALWSVIPAGSTMVNLNFDPGTIADISLLSVGTGRASARSINSASSQVSVPVSETPLLIRGNYSSQSIRNINPYGDLNRDGVVTIADALLALRIAVNLDKPTADDLSIGDIAPLDNGNPAPDGTIGLGDALLVLKKAVGLINW